MFELSRACLGQMMYFDIQMAQKDDVSLPAHCKVGARAAESEVAGQPAETPAVFQFSSCLSRACLGKWSSLSIYMFHIYVVILYAEVAGKKE
jgi:hypothetical protein